MTTKIDSLDIGEQYHFTGLNEGMGYVFREAAEDFDLRAFTELFLNSRIFYDYFTNLTLFSQSAGYILECYEDELKETSRSFADIKPHRLYEKDIAFWFGYLFGYWYQCLGKDFPKLTKEDIEWLWGSYDVLHTQDIEYVYDIYADRKKEEHSRSLLEKETDKGDCSRLLE